MRGELVLIGTNRGALVRRRAAAILLAVSAVVTGCGGNLSTERPGSTPGGPPPGSEGPRTPVPTGFFFAATDVADYYRSIGYACSTAQPSTVAAGYSVVTCVLVDGAGRTRAVGLVTDAAGDLGNAFASVSARDGETYLDPDDALEPLAAFLGTMLGETRGGDAAVWLKEHLGAVFERTTSGSLTIATYTERGDDPSVLFVEVANQTYLAASPAPSR
jgi:hypothetical protein